jgi:IS605 OrfB family transposase
MNKCIKVILKSCDEFEYNQIKQMIKDMQYLNYKALNNAMSMLYSYDRIKEQIKTIYGDKVEDKAIFGKSYNAYIENRMNEDMIGFSSGNIAQTRQFVNNQYNTDKKKGLLKGNVSISTFKRENPIIIHNKSFKLRNMNSYTVEIGLFNTAKQKELNVKRLNFIIDKIDSNKKQTINKIINGEYKQGSAQLKITNKGKIELTISFSFEVKKEDNLQKNKILGVDLGITNVATMSVYNTDFEDWERISYKESLIDGTELIHYRQKIEAKNRQLSISSKNVGDGRIGHGYKTRMKPLEKTRNKVNKFRDTYNHKTSRYIVNLALKYKCAVIQMEDLSGFTEEQSESLLKNWSYYDLQQKVKYKAEEVGIEIVFINPKYTSKRCSKCGNIHLDNRDCKNNQSKFECKVCGHKENADINASKNISIPFIDKIISETELLK